MMEKREFMDVARDSLLTERQAEAYWHRQVAGHDRTQSAAEMETSASNVDNLERAAREKIIRASNTVALADAVGALPEDNLPPIGTCAHCDEPASTLKPDPRDGHKPIEEMRQLCPDCYDDLS